MTTTIDTERAWLERIETSKIVGICLLDEDGRLVQRLDDDPALRDALAEYQTQRIRELVRSERPGRSTEPVTYPILEAL
ncbi:hypothetical protein DYU11_21185 [Fibrisoma montanum]|uniref:Uncharacterized protein n=1 Tax=Fibrisoma montanum TaxID=2305895 RepID=A0A418M491_9BACT|nr:hypothetical protein [Fibrisoma montanum]RIV20561.1 hypothetical protein DYU11_21185 [Fibrisoma montanum]